MKNPKGVSARLALVSSARGVVGWLDGSTKCLGRIIPNTVTAGLLAIAVVYVSSASLISFSTPWWTNRGDMVPQIDHVWRMYKGEIPGFYDGVEYPPFKEMTGDKYKYQTTSMHPPLFYLIHAPFIGPLLDNGEWKKALAVGWMINIGIGVLCIAAFAWAGWVFGGRRKEIYAITVPALAVLMDRFLLLNIDFANDGLLVLFSVLTFVVQYKILKHSLSLRLFVPLVVLSILGMATRAPYIVILVTSILCICIAPLVHGGRNADRINVFKQISIAIALCAFVLMSVGWFYYFWNYQLSGSWWKASPPNYTGGRPYSSLESILLGEKLWQLFYAKFAAHSAVSTAITSFAVAGLLQLRRVDIRGLLMDRPRMAMYGLMSLAFGGTFLTQIVEVVGHGTVNFRYMLPALLPIVLLLATGLLQFRGKIKAIVVFVAVASMATVTVLQYPDYPYVAKVLGGVKNIEGSIPKLYYAIETNGFYSLVATVLLVGFVAGLALYATALSRVSSRARA